MGADRYRYGFILEALQYSTKSMTAKEKYIKFWFEANLSIEEAFSMNPIIVGLHHSWTPEWYKELSIEDILKQECLLSRMLYNILNGSLRR